MHTDDYTEKKSDPRSIQYIMSQSKLAVLVRKGQLLNKIENSLLEILPEEFGPYCQVLNVKEQQLMLAVNSSAIATCLRYQEDSIVKSLQKFHITAMECVVRPL